MKKPQLPAANSIEIKQNNLFTQARYDFTALEMDLMSCILHSLKQYGFEQSRVYVTLEFLREQHGAELKRWHIIEALDGLMSKRGRIVTAKGEYLSIQFISAAQYTTGGGRIFIEVPLTSLECYKPLHNNFTIYQLEKSLSFKSKYSKRLYQLLNQFKVAGAWKVNLHKLKELLGVIDADGHEKFKSYTLFTTRVIEATKQEFAEKDSDITFGWEATGKDGKKVTEITFFIYAKQISSAKAPWRDTDLFARLLTEFKLSPYEADEIFRNVPQVSIEKTCQWLNVRMSDQDIKNIGGYSATIFKNKYQLSYNVGSNTES